MLGIIVYPDFLKSVNVKKVGARSGAHRVFLDFNVSFIAQTT